MTYLTPLYVKYIGPAFSAQELHEARQIQQRQIERRAHQLRRRAPRSWAMREYVERIQEAENDSV